MAAAGGVSAPLHPLQQVLALILAALRLLHLLLIIHIRVHARVCISIAAPAHVGQLLAVILRHPEQLSSRRWPHALVTMDVAAGSTHHGAGNKRHELCVHHSNSCGRFGEAFQLF